MVAAWRHLALTVSMGWCQVWDVRTGGTAVRTLTSSGAVLEEAWRPWERGRRVNTLPPHEALINAVQVNGNRYPGRCC